MLASCLATSAATAATTYTPKCPATINVTESVAANYPDWRTLNSESNHFLDGVALYSGKPEAQAILAPEMKGNKGKWTFQAADEIYLVCSYNQTSVQLTQPLQPQTTACTVTYNKHTLGANGPIPTSIICQKR